MSRRTALLVAGLILVLNGVPATAQIPLPGVPGPYVIDVRGTASSVPALLPFFPPLGTTTLVPTRGIGFDVGAHVYPMSLGAARLGIGVNLVRVGGWAETVVAPPSSGGSTSTGTPAGTNSSAGSTGPRVEVALMALAPQVSFNFGKADGWSYVSAGLGVVSVTTRVTRAPVASANVEQDNGALRAINFGGGARWFTSSHLAVGFDLRFHRVAAGDTTPSTMLIAASVGISLR